MNEPSVPITTRPITTKILRGKPLRDALLEQAKAVLEATGFTPRLVIVQMGANPASTAYIAHKLEACGHVGIAAEVLHLEETETETTLHATVRALAEDPEVDAIIVQTPLPEGFNMQAALDLVPAAKDIDGLSSANIALRRAGAPKALWPATPLGIVRMLQHAGVTIKGQTIAVIGHGKVVGAPLQEVLKAEGATVLGIDKQTPTPAAITRKAPVVVAAAGSPGLVKKHWLQPGAVVVDVGLTRLETGLKGDVDRADVLGTAAILTPSPGGVGPLTVASLLTNIVDAVLMKHGKPRHNWVV